jgi:hypothetical protein
MLFFAKTRSRSPATYRLYEPRPFYVFPQRGPNLVNGGIDAVLGIKENIFAPQSLDNLLPTHHLPIFFQQQDEQFHGNAFELLRGPWYRNSKRALTSSKSPKL